MYPTDRRYSKDHEWIVVEGEEAVIGITDFAQQELGDIVYVELPQVGQEVKAGDVVGTIESVKAVSEIFAPVAGTVLEGNQALDETPEAVNQDPHGNGWYCKLRLADPAELETLLDADGYQKLLGG
jgi:glycine cleavage system H protein